MKSIKYIYTKDSHKWAVVSRDPSKPGYLIDTNEYLVMDGNQAVLTDPGGLEIFPSVFSSISQEFNPQNIKYLFSSHQDPDIISSLSLWLEINPELKCYISWLWASFVPHFGGNDQTIIPVADEGGDIVLEKVTLNMVPAHHLHSAGNFHLYDKKAKVYFSGDVGAALLPPEMNDLYVEDFSAHIKHATGFHQRWMGSNEAKRDWCERVSKLEIDMLCPQHGSIYTGDDVGRFINWFDELKVGAMGN